MRHRPLAWGVPLLCLSWAATLLVDPWADERVTDFAVLRWLADLFVGGAAPYREVPFEYPPLAAPVIALPGLVGTGEETYRLAFALAMLACAAVVLLLVRRLARVTGGSEALAVAAAAVSPLLLGAVIRNHFDLVPVALALAALASIASRRVELGFSLLGVGAMTKLFPLAMAPVALAWLWARGERRAALRGAAALAITVAVVAAGWLAYSADGARDTLDYHAERPVQVESVPAGAVHVADALGASTPRVVQSHRSDGLVHPLTGEAAGLSAAAGVGALALLALGAARARSRRELVLAALAAVACVAVFGKVLSPQFLAWTIPLLALALAWRMWPLAAALGGATLLTFVEFPFRYYDVVDLEPGALWLVGARNALLLAAVGLAARALWQAELPVSSPAGAAARSSRPGRRRSPRPAPR
jgi:hypothetical protein